MVSLYPWGRQRLKGSSTGRSGRLRAANPAVGRHTDNETYAGGTHPSQALKQYRKETRIDAKMIVAGMTATSFSIANPDDGWMLDVVGFDDSARP